jgi:hypothetical protein
LEVYQGDDALVVLKSEIDKFEVSRMYCELGLEVNPEKTWVTQGNTEYLHELYFRDHVRAFPARIFRAIAWRKPLANLAEGDYGAAKTQSFISVLRMAARRGLDVVDIARRFIKTLVSNFDEPKFTAWLRTPYIFGGFGFGTSGRMELKCLTRNTRSLRVFVDGISNRSGLWKHAAKMRAMGVVPMPGIRNTWVFGRVRGEDKMDPLRASELHNQPRPRTDWMLDDVAVKKDAYLRKLKLEWKLREGKRIFESDLPSHFGQFKDLDKAYRTYRRMVAEAIGIESAIAGPETYFRIKDWANRVWAGMCFRFIRGDRADGERAKLCRLAHHLVMSRAFRDNMVRVAI